MNELQPGCLPAHTIAQLARQSVLPQDTEHACGHLTACQTCWERYAALVSPLKGVQVRDYLILEEIGRGAASVVFAAWRCSPPIRLVALKVLWLEDEEQRIRFEREAAIHKLLDAPGIVKCHRFGQEGALSYYEMELVRGRPLDVYLAEQALPLAQRLVLFERVCDALGEAHKHQIAHRDIKPNNVLVDASGEPHILDFGIGAAKANDARFPFDSKRTKLGDILGTIKYMSPEQAWGGLIGGPIDHRSDIWTLGVILFEIVTGGRHPYSLSAVPERSAEEALLHRIRTELPDAPAIADSEFSPGIKRILSRCLVWDKRFRFQSASELAEEIQRCRLRRGVRTKRLPIRFVASRFFTDFAVHRRGALWFASVVGTLFLLSVFLFVGNVRWEELQPSARYSRRSDDGGLVRALAPDDFVIVGITDSCIQQIPESARRIGLEGVSTIVTSWRALHGTIMDRLGGAQPRAVVWDFFLRSPQAQDATFVDAVKRLTKLGIPVMLAVDQWDDAGVPKLSSGIIEPLRGIARFGGIQARDMVKRPGEFVIVLRRDAVVVPSLALSTVAALAHPNWELLPEWRNRESGLTLLYQERGGGRVFPFRDRMNLSKVFASREADSGIDEGDEIGCKTLSLRPPESWERRVVNYKRLLDAPPEQFRAWVAGKIVLFGDLRTGGWLRRADRHRVRYDERTVPDVPGCFLLADAVVGLSGNTYLRSAFPINGFGFVLTASLCLTGCLFPAVPWLSRRLDRTAQLALFGFTIAGCSVSALLMLQSQTAAVVVSAMCAASFLCCTAVSTLIEATRRRFRVAPALWTHESGPTRVVLQNQNAAASAPSNAIPANERTESTIAPARETVPSLSEIG